MACPRSGVLLGLCLLILLSAFSLGLPNTHRAQRAATKDGSQTTHPKYSLFDFGNKLTALLGRTRASGEIEEAMEAYLSVFDTFLKGLKDLAERAPDSLAGFKAESVLRLVTKTDIKAKALANTCLKSPDGLHKFLVDVLKALTTPKDDKGPGTSKEGGDDGDKKEVGKIKTDDSSEDNKKDAAVTGVKITLHSATAKDKDDNDNDDKDKMDGMDTMGDLFHRLSKDSVGCITAFFDNYEENVLCQLFSHQSPRAFVALMKSGVECTKTLDDEDDLDLGLQKALWRQLTSKDLKDWTKQDLVKAFKQAPDVIDDSIFEKLPKAVITESLPMMAKQATRPRAQPGLALAVRQTLVKDKLADLDAAKIAQLGKGLFVLTDHELAELNSKALLDADLSTLFADDKKDDDDDDDEEGKRIAIGRRMKQARPANAKQLGKVTSFLYNDLEFLYSVGTDDLYEALDELSVKDLDADEAAGLFQRISQSSKFPELDKFTIDKLKGLRSVLAGMPLSQLSHLPEAVVKGARDDIKDVHFGETQARALLKKIGEKASELTLTEAKNLGQLVRGLDTKAIGVVNDQVADELLDSLDDKDLNDAQKTFFMSKALNVVNKRKAKILQLPAFSDVLSIETLKAEAPSPDSKKKVLWRPSQAAVLLSKLQGELRPAVLPLLGTRVRGLLPSNFKSLVRRPEDVSDLANVLNEQQHLLTSAQIDNVLGFIEKYDFDEGDAVITLESDFVAQKGTFLPYLREEQFKRLYFDLAAKKTFVKTMSTMDTSKLSRAQLTYIASVIQRMTLSITKQLNKDDADFVKIRELGEFFAGLTAENMEKFNAKAIVQNLDTLGVLPLIRSQARVILHKVAEFDNNWKCKSSLLINLGPLLQFANEDIFENLCDDALSASLAVMEKRINKRREVVARRRQEGLWRDDSMDLPGSSKSANAPTPFPTRDAMVEDVEGQKRLAKRLVAAAVKKITSPTDGRRRRAADATEAKKKKEEQVTCSMLRPMGQDLANADVKQLMKIPDTEFRDCLDVFGSVSNWNSADLAALFFRTKQVLGDPSGWTTEVLRQAGVLASMLNVKEFKALKTLEVDALYSIARHNRLHVTQLEAGFQRWLQLNKGGDITKVTAAEFSSMSDFVCGLTSPQVRQLPADVFKQSQHAIGKTKQCPANLVLAYSARALNIYGDDVSKWSPAIIGELGHIIGGWPVANVKQLTADQLSLIRPLVIGTLPDHFLKALSDIQLKQLSTNQVNSLTADQYKVFNYEQRVIIRSKVSVAFALLDEDKEKNKEKEKEKEKENNKGSGSGETVRWSLVSLMAAFILSTLFC